jgi:hypothetical protein
MLDLPKLVTYLELSCKTPGNMVGKKNIKTKEQATHEIA